MADLHDELAQIGLNHVDAGGFQGVDEVDLLADHRLGLDAALAVRTSSDADDDALGLLAVGGEVHLAAVALDVGDELLEVIVEVIQRVLLDLARERAQRIGIGQIEQPELPAGVLPQDGIVDGGLELLIPRGLDADGMEIELRAGGLIEEFGGVGINGRGVSKRIGAHRGGRL